MQKTQESCLKCRRDTQALSPLDDPVWACERNICCSSEPRLVTGCHGRTRGSGRCCLAWSQLPLCGPQGLHLGNSTYPLLTTYVAIPETRPWGLVHEAQRAYEMPVVHTPGRRWLRSLWCGHKGRDDEDEWGSVILLSSLDVVWAHFPFPSSEIHSIRHGARGQCGWTQADWSLCLRKHSKPILLLTGGQWHHCHLRRAAHNCSSAQAAVFGSGRLQGPVVSHVHFQVGCEGSACLLGLAACKLDVIKKIDQACEAWWGTQ